MARVPGYDFMVLLTYTPRANSVARGYEDWLRRVDNPFFNATDGVQHYSNWKIAGGAHPQMGTHFDFLGIDGLGSLDEVMNGERLNGFRKEWRRLWGVDPEGTPGVNAQAYLCERIAKTPRPGWGNQALVVPESTANQRLDGFDTWRVRKSLRKTTLGFPEFHVGFASDPAAFADLKRKHAARGAVAGDLVAAP